MAALYRATRVGDFPLVQAIHNRLARFVCLLEDHDIKTHEKIYREVAYVRGILAPPNVRDPSIRISKPGSSYLPSTTSR